MKTEKQKKIIIALDFNPTAHKVAKTAYLLAKSMGAHVTLVHVMADEGYYTPYSLLQPYPSTGSMGVSLQEAAFTTENTLEKAITKFLEKTKEDLGDEAIECLTVTGNCAESILSTATKLKADIIVMGSHSRRWLENIIMGSVAESVLRHTTIPLYIIPTKKLKS